VYIEINGKKIKVHRHGVNTGKGAYCVYAGENDSKTDGIQEAIDVIAYTSNVYVYVARGQSSLSFKNNQ